jgi:lipid A 3-O-deacylase
MASQGFSRRTPQGSHLLEREVEGPVGARGSIHRVLLACALTAGLASRAGAETDDGVATIGSSDTTLPSVSVIDAGPPNIPAGRAWQLTLYQENDQVFGTDANYTQGFKAILTTRAPEPMRFLAEYLPPFDGQMRSFGITFGHSLYTPVDWTRTDWIPNDRPYGAWLYLGAFASFGGTDRFLSLPFEAFLEIDVGVVGPRAIGEQVQNTTHRAIGVETFQGWDNQIKDEVGVSITYQRSWTVFHATLVDPGNDGPSFLGLELDLQPHLGLRGGNVATYPNAGAQVRLGRGLVRARRFATSFESFGETWEGPSGESTEREPLNPWYVYARVDAKYVVHDVFLDGNLTRASHSIPKKDVVIDYEVGLAVQLFTRVTLGTALTLRSPQFDGQDGHHRFASFTLSVAW